MRYSGLISLFVVLLISMAGCSSLKEGLWLHSTQYATGGIPSVFNHSKEITLFDFILTRRDDSIEGTVVIKSDSNTSKRVVMTSFFGMTFLDFELNGSTIKINYCIEQLNREKVILLLKKDFEILFNPDHSPITKYVFESNGNIAALEQGNGITRTLMRFEKYSEGYPEEVLITHPWLKIKLKLTKSKSDEN